MISSRAFAASLLVFSVIGLSSACGSDDESPTGTGGKAGKGGSAGSKAGTGGKSGTGGAGGTSGSSGKGGSSGTSGAGGTSGASGAGGSSGATGSGGNAGTAGNAGAGGAAGNDGSVGAGGQVDASTDVSSDGAPVTDAARDGTSGAGGSAGSDAAAGPKQCIETCTTDAQCGSDGGANQPTCIKSRCLRLQTDKRCESNADCVPIASRWFVTCSATKPCTGALVCIDVGGGDGRCATTPSDAGACASPFAQEVVNMPRLGGGGNVAVCGNTSNRCSATTKTCQAACTSDDDCGTVGIGSHCNTTTQLCECQGATQQDADSQCSTPSMTTSLPHCNMATGRCECRTDADCRRADGGAREAEKDVCVQGVCSCSGNGVCVKDFPGTTEACQ